MAWRQEPEFLLILEAALEFITRHFNPVPMILRRRINCGILARRDSRKTKRFEMKQAFRLIAILFLSACSGAENGAVVENGGAQAESATSWNRGAMVAAADVRAAEAAIEMLEKGGHAVDAAIAAHAVLGLVEPQSSGLGGSAFMLVHEADGGELSYYDGREMAPAGATIDMFMQDGERLGRMQTWSSGITTGVPGTVALYKLAHDTHGRLPWSDLFQPAIRLASDGFEVSPRLANYMPMMAQRSKLDENPGSAEYFYPNGEALEIGDIRTNAEYANTLSRIATEGPDAFYSGAIAESIVKTAAEEPFAGPMNMADFANYRAVKRDAVCGKFREMEICSTAPPSSGAAIIMMAGLYDHLVSDAVTESDKVAAFVDAQRLAYADRDHYVGDPDVIGVPLEDLINPVYLEHRATERFEPGEDPTPGNPTAVLHQDTAAFLWGADNTLESSGTTHFSIIDGDGNAAALTASVGAPFGSTRWAEGFVLNNQMSDFDTEYHAGDAPRANAIAPGKRPRSSMSPTIIYDDRRNVRMLTGSPGGNSILAYIAKTIVGVFDWDMSAQEAVDFPNIIARGSQVRVEISADRGKEFADELASRGYNVKESDGENSGLHVIVVRPELLDGAADKRREGVVLTTPKN
ncbi:MAG: gamma-glutamyltranspeptidase/glutathione hydrolase [Woeseiaceae bacterium]